MMLFCVKVEVVFGDIFVVREICINCIKENFWLIIDNMWIIIMLIGNIGS